MIVSEYLLAVLLCLVPAGPLALAVLWLWAPLRQGIARVLPWAALPALALALLAPDSLSLRLDGLLLGVTLGLDDTRRVFLLLTALIWLSGGLYLRGDIRLLNRQGLPLPACTDRAMSYLPLLWLLTLSGNLGLIVSLDVVSFYTSFALMSFAVYGLLIHWGTPQALQAGRVYLVLAVLGEALMLAGFLLASQPLTNLQSPLLADLQAALPDLAQRDVVIALLWLGFGVKAALPILHISLPLIYTAAPTPVAAVLAGAMIKAGLLGWLLTLPLGLSALPHWGNILGGAGGLAILAAVVIGIHQHHPKTVLAYSSISQMGLFSLMLGLALHVPALWPALGAVVLVYALHHSLVKAALFLNIGILSRRESYPVILLWALALLPVLSLLGLLNSGLFAKYHLKTVLESATPGPAFWPDLNLLMFVASVATTLLMARYLWLLSQQRRAYRITADMWAGWGLLLLSSSLAILWLALWGLTLHWPGSGTDFMGLLLPVLLGVFLSLLAWRWLRAWPIPPGDVLSLLKPFPLLAKYLWSGVRYALQRLSARWRRLRLWVERSFTRNHALGRWLERILRREAALSFMLLLVVAMLLSLRSLP